MKAPRICSSRPSLKWNWIGSKFCAGAARAFVASAASAAVFASTTAASAENVFRLHLFTEPTTFLAYQQKNSNTGYVLSQTFWGFLRYQDGKILPGLASKCDWKGPLKVRCELKKDLKFSDGTSITTADYERAFRKILDPAKPARRADLLFPVKNAQAILEGKEPFEKLGAVFTKDAVEFTLGEKYGDFLYNLTSPYLSPIPDKPEPTAATIAAYPVTGPYKFKSYTPSDKLTLEPNPHFKGAAELPNIEFLFVADDAVALNLYRTGKLDFNRRLPTMNIPEFEKKPEFHAVPLLRFDYFGLRGFLKPEQRKALAESLDYEELRKLFHAKPRPGCPGIPKEWVGRDICHDTKPPTKEAAAKLGFPPKTSLIFSRLGGDDHRRAMEWAQDQWRRNLGMGIELEQMENQIYVSRLEKGGNEIFRKGVSLDRPTCLAAVEIFHSKSPENYLGMSALDSEIDKLRIETNEKKKKRLCAKMVGYLMENHWIIPTGPIYFSILASTKWDGWKLNELNELDLSELRVRK